MSTKKIILSLLLGLSFSTQTMAEKATSSSVQGLAPKSNVDSQGNGLFNTKALEIYALITNENNSQKIAEKFAEYCGDQDFDDILSWSESQNGSSTYKFSCVKDSESNIKDEMLFVVTMENDQLVKIDSLEAKKQIDNKAQDVKFTFKEATKYSVAVVGSTLIAGAMAKKVFPNEADKVKHAVFSAAMAGGAAGASRYMFDLSPNQSALAGGAFSLLVGVAKEVYDKQHPDKHTSDIRDFKADLIGVVLSSVTLKFTFDL